MGPYENVDPSVFERIDYVSCCISELWQYYCSICRKFGGKMECERIQIFNLIAMFVIILVTRSEISARKLCYFRSFVVSTRSTTKTWQFICNYNSSYVSLANLKRYLLLAAKRIVKRGICNKTSVHDALTIQDIEMCSVSYRSTMSLVF